MSWSRIKTILIILFLLTDIFLASSIFIAEKKETEISPAVLDASQEILKNHNLTLNTASLPKRSSAPVYKADNAVTDYDSFAKLLLGDDSVSVNSAFFTSEKGTLSFFGDSFSFEAKKSDGGAEALSQKKAQKTAFNLLKGLGFNLSAAKAVSSSENGGIWTFTIQDFAENMPVFSSQITVSASQSGIISLSGSWFNRRDMREQEGGLKSITGILIDFASEYGDGAPAEITAAELGYSVFDDENYHKSASLIPVTKITLNNSDAYFIDSRSNED